MIQNDVLGNAKAEGRAEGRTAEKYKIALSLLEQVFEGDHISISLFRRKDTKNIVSGKIRRSYFARIDIKYALAAR